MNLSLGKETNKVSPTKFKHPLVPTATISLWYTIYCKEELREDIEIPALLIITFAINKLFKTLLF